MKYKNTITGFFLKRPNRFIAHVLIDGREEICHVKNTGRCKELLTPNAKVVLEISDNPNRKTKFDLIAVYKGNRLINMDSQAPNKAVYEYLLKKYPNADLIKPEYTIDSSRIDFYMENAGEKIFIEVKGCTLENDNIVSFPDAPTQRGAKHLRELTELVHTGSKAMVFFVIQMENVEYFTPNEENDKIFAEALRTANHEGVEIIAMECKVTENSMEINKPVKVRLF